jgi:hypothetical protein
MYHEAPINSQERNMTFLIIGIFYLVGFLVMFGILTALAWWLRWAIACFYAMVPITAAVWAAWLVIALPINLLFDGWAFEKKVVAISHWLNDTTLAVFWFAISAPFKAVGLIIEILYWCVN